MYSVDLDKGKLKLVDVIRSEMESAPRHIKISKDGQFIYIVHEWKCFVDVYKYVDKKGIPYFDKIQSVPTVSKGASHGSAASALSFSTDYKYLISTNAGDNSVVIYDVNQETGMLKTNLCLPISGEYPKDAEMFPNNKYVVSLNHESNTMTFFKVDLKNNTLTMNGAPMKIHEPNSIIFHKVSK